MTQPPNFPLQQTVSVAQAASVLAVATTPAVDAPALAVMEPVARVTSANATKIAAQELPEPFQMNLLSLLSHCHRS